MTDELHDRADALALDVEASIRAGEQVLAAVSDVPVYRTARGDQLDAFMRRFGAT